MTHSYPGKQTSKNKQVKNKQIKCEALGSLQYGCKSSFRLLAQAESTIEAKRFFLVTVNPPMLNPITFPLRTYAKSLHEENITLLAETKVVFKTHPFNCLGLGFEHIQEVRIDSRNSTQQILVALDKCAQKVCPVYYACAQTEQLHNSSHAIWTAFSDSVGHGIHVVSYPWIFGTQTISSQAQMFFTHFRPARTQPSGRFVTNKLLLHNFSTLL